jgi:hypothetical protein
MLLTCILGVGLTQDGLDRTIDEEAFSEQADTLEGEEWLFDMQVSSSPSTTCLSQSYPNPLLQSPQSQV